MKKTLSRTLAMLLMLLMVVGMLPAEVFAASGGKIINDVKITGLAEPQMAKTASADYDRIPDEYGYGLYGECYWYESSEPVSDIKEALSRRPSGAYGLDIYKEFTGKFQAGLYYTFVAVVQADNGYSFNSDFSNVNVTVNGKKANKTTNQELGWGEFNSSGDDYRPTKNFFIWITFGPIEAINDITVKGLAEPVIGKKASADYDRIPDEYGYGLYGECCWYDYSAPLSSIKNALVWQPDGRYVLDTDVGFKGEFQEGNYYTFVMLVQADKGYNFNSDFSKVNVTVNGRQANKIAFQELGWDEFYDGEDMRPTKQFIAWITYGPVTVVGNPSIMVTPPRVGVKVSPIATKELGAEDHYTIWQDKSGYKVRWVETDSTTSLSNALKKDEFNGTFKEGKYYTALACLQPNNATSGAYYSFGNTNCTAFINHNSAVKQLGSGSAWSNSPADLMVGYTFGPLKKVIKPWNGNTVTWDYGTIPATRTDIYLYRIEDVPGTYANCRLSYSQNSFDISSEKPGVYYMTLYGYDKSGNLIAFDVSDTVELKSTLTSVKIKTQPSKTSYKSGENFNPTGLVMEAAYSNGTKKDIPYNNSTKNNFSFFDNINLKVGQTSVTVSYTENGTAKSATQAITVVQNPETCEHPMAYRIFENKIGSVGNEECHCFTCELCGYYSGWEAHKFNEPQLVSGELYTFCSVCGYEKREHMYDPVTISVVRIEDSLFYVGGTIPTSLIEVPEDYKKYIVEDIEWRRKDGKPLGTTFEQDVEYILKVTVTTQGQYELKTSGTTITGVSVDTPNWVPYDRWKHLSSGWTFEITGKPIDTAYAAGKSAIEVTLPSDIAGKTANEVFAMIKVENARVTNPSVLQHSYVVYDTTDLKNMVCFSAKTFGQSSEYINHGDFVFKPGHTYKFSLGYGWKKPLGWKKDDLVVTNGTNPDILSIGKAVTSTDFYVDAIIEAKDTTPGITVARRLAGDNRIATAIEISKESYNSASTVVLANSLNYADALIGTSYAAAKKAPILLTAPDELDAGTLAEINRLKAKNVTILGGYVAIGKPIEDALKSKTTPHNYPKKKEFSIPLTNTWKTP